MNNVVYYAKTFGPPYNAVHFVTDIDTVTVDEFLFHPSECVTLFSFWLGADAE